MTTDCDLALARKIAAEQIGWDTYEDAAAHNHHTESYVAVALAAIAEVRQATHNPALAKLKEVLDFYDALPSEHAKGEVELLDSITALLAKAKAPSRA